MFYKELSRRDLNTQWSFCTSFTVHYSFVLKKSSLDHIWFILLCCIKNTEVESQQFHPFKFLMEILFLHKQLFVIHFQATEWDLDHEFWWALNDSIRPPYV